MENIVYSLLNTSVNLVECLHVCVPISNQFCTFFLPVSVNMYQYPYHCLMCNMLTLTLSTCAVICVFAPNYHGSIVFRPSEQQCYVSL